MPLSADSAELAAPANDLEWREPFPDKIERTAEDLQYYKPGDSAGACSPCSRMGWSDSHYNSVESLRVAAVLGKWKCQCW